MARIAGGKRHNNKPSARPKSKHHGAKDRKKQGLTRRVLGSIAAVRGKVRKAAKKRRKALKAARKEKRKRDARRRKSVAKKISRNKHLQWVRKVRRLGLLRAVWNAGRWAGLCAAAALFSAWYWTCLLGHRTGNTVRGLQVDLLTALRGPFAGLTTDWRRFQQAREARHQREIDEAIGRTSRKNDTPGGDIMQKPEIEVRTNLSAIIEAIRDAPTIGQFADDGPHGSQAHHWHRHAAELAEALAELMSRDAETIAETLPPEGQAHEITTLIPNGFSASAEQMWEATEAWEIAQGIKVPRLYSQDPREKNWDVSTMPED